MFRSGELKIISFSQGLKLAGVFLPLATFIAIYEFFLPLRLNTIGTKLWLIGVFISCSWLITTSLDIFWGKYIEKIGKKQAITLGIIVYLIFTSSFALTDNLWLLLFCNIFAYLGFDILFIALKGFLVSLSPRRVFNYAISGFYPVWAVGFFIGPLLGVLIFLKFGYFIVYSLAWPLLLVSLVLFLFIFGRFREKLNLLHKLFFRRRHHSLSSVSYFLGILKKENLILAGSFICAFWYTMMQIGIPLLFFLEENNLWASALVSAGFIFPFIFIDFFAGFLANTKKRRVLIIVLGFILGSFSLLVFYLSQQIWLSILAAVFSSLGINLAWNVFEIEAGLITKPGEEAKVQGILIFAKNLGWDTSPLFFGLVAQFFGLRLPFLLLAVAFVFLALIFFYKREQIK